LSAERRPFNLDISPTTKSLMPHRRFTPLTLPALACAALALAAALAAPAARADSVALTSADRGWYGRSGFHNAADNNYQVGVSDGYRNFFVFDLTGVEGQITSARLELANHATSASGHVPFALYDVETPISTLSQSQQAAAGIFQDLGTGVIYGSVDDAASMPTVTVHLNSAFLDALNNRQSDQIALGGRLDDAQNPSAYAFTGTGSCFGGPRLILQTSPSGGDVPSAPLPGVAVAGLALLVPRALRRRR
jgi:hypothetical protein